MTQDHIDSVLRQRLANERHGDLADMLEDAAARLMRGEEMDVTVLALCVLRMREAARRLRVAAGREDADG